ncbi:hypothetical protein SAMN05443580_13914 [Variovorax sp. OV084]|nr:hypothetical protein SAMN05443580_13914 [Variovorax sp. OV084]
MCSGISKMQLDLYARGALPRLLDGHDDPAFHPLESQVQMAAPDIEPFDAHVLDIGGKLWLDDAHLVFHGIDVQAKAGLQQPERGAGCPCGGPAGLPRRL